LSPHSWCCAILLLPARLFGQAEQPQKPIPTVLGKQFSYNSAGRQPHNESNYYILAPESSTAKSARIARFPCATESSEVAFAQAFVQPTNGPESEDSASYNPETFEKIAENVKLR
jgi:hypothetical protein